jgi:hypothetical protein
MLDLDKVTITRAGDDVTIVHLATNTSVRVPVKQLVTWCLSQVRKAVQ